MMQSTKHICKCGSVATTRYKPTGEWLCSERAVVKMIIDILFRHGVDNVYLAPMDDGTLDLFVPLVDLLPVSIHRN